MGCEVVYLLLRARKLQWTHAKYVRKRVAADAADCANDNVFASGTTLMDKKIN